MLKDFKALQIKLASPEEILSWSHGEVKKPETINYRTHKSEVDGLMDEKIFGPTKNYECYCGKYKKIRYKGIICDKCGVEVTHKRVRRERLGHIKLATPVVHIWYSYGVPNKLALILGIAQKKLNTVIYFSRYMVTNTNKEQKDKAISILQENKTENMDVIRSEEKEKILEISEKYKKDRQQLKKEIKEKEKLEMQIERLKANEAKEKAKMKSIYAQHISKTEEKFDKQIELVENLEQGITLSEEEYTDLVDIGIVFFEASMGAEAIYKLLEQVDVEEEIAKAKAAMQETRSKIKLRKLRKRLRVFEGMKTANINPTWIVMHYLPVVPPDLRPIIQLPGGRFATSDLNDLYRRVINRNNRLKRLIDLGAPEIILRNEKRMLQESVDALIDNSHRPGNPVMNSRQQPYKSLSDMLRGKQGRFRQNLLGKRVDFSGRSVIVSGPELSINECGLPKTMALELFKPFVIHEIIERGLAPNIKAAKNYFEERSDEVWDILEEVIDDRPVLLNRAPTLHKNGIQAFFPVLVEGNAIRLHPLVCKGFNADFDGDQMAVHVPLAQRAVDEVKERMFPQNNILLMADGNPVVNTEKDMAYGIYYLTGIEKNQKQDKKKEKSHIYSFANPERAIGAYEAGHIKLREKIKVLIGDEIIDTTPGRLILNKHILDQYGFVNEHLNKKSVAKISAKILEKYGNEEAVKFLDSIEKLGFKYATESGFSISMSDFVVSDKKEKLLEKISKQEEEIMEYYENGLLSDDERRKVFEEAWINIVDEVASVTWNEYVEEENLLAKLNESGASPAENPLKQISGVRGLIIDPMGKIVELPLRSNYKEGLTSLEYFVAARGTRKALADVALKTSESGYLTRKLVDVAQDVITRMDDCGTQEGIHLYKSDDRRIEFDDRISGRVAAEDIKGKDKNIIVKFDEQISPEVAEQIAKDKSIEKVKVRSVVTCESEYGVCKKCYGFDLGTKKMVEKGIAVGVIAAQAIGEASTQLTLDAKHRSGSATAKDITQGLPRVEELLETRTPKAKALLAEISGKATVEIDEVTGIKKITITQIKDSQNSKEGDSDNTKSSKDKAKNKKNSKKKTKKAKEKVNEEEYELDIWETILIENGDEVEKGQPLTMGSIDPKELMELKGPLAVQKYIVDNIQETFGNQGIGIDDKHVEIAVKQMMRFMLVKNPGDSDLLPGDYIDMIIVKKENEKLKAQEKNLVKAERKVMGLTNASLRTESFLSAASFQDQVRVLTDAAILGKVDTLKGLKENVIIGRPVPLGDELEK